MSRQIKLGFSTLSNSLKFSRLFHSIGMLMLCLVMMSYIPFSYAAASKAIASVSQSHLQLGEVFELSIEYKGDASSTDIDTSALEQNFTISSRSFGSSFQWINGKSDHISNWKFQLSARNTQMGDVIIPSLTINGEKTQPIKLTVSKAPASPEIAGLATIENTLSSDTLYPNQTTTLSMHLLVRSNLNYRQQPELLPPSSEGLKVVALGDVESSQQVINGITTNVYQQDFSVTADKSGTFTIMPPSFQGQIVVRDRQSNSQRILPISATSEPINVTVKDIPADYQGAWLPTQDLVINQSWLDDQGNLLSTNNDLLETQMGQPITRQLEIEIKDTPAENFPKLTVDYPQGIRTYDDKPVFTQEDGYTIMALKQVIIPNQTGTYTLPDVRVPWWNSDKNQQQVTSVSGLSLTVKADPNASTPPPSNNESTDNGSLNDQINDAQQTQSPTSDLNNAIEADDQNTTPALNQQSDSNVDSSPQTDKLWFYLACAFIGLFVIMLIIVLWLMSKIKKLDQKPSQRISDSPMNQVDTSPALIQALQQTDGVEIQQQYQRWLKNSSHLSIDLKQQIQAEMDKLMSSFYGKETQTFDTNKLQSLIKKAAQTKENNLNSNDALAKL